MRTYQIIIDDMICRWGYSKQYIRNVLAQYKGKHVDVRISSLGGDLDHGLDIRQQFLDHGDVTVYLTGFVASAATIIAMGAKRVCMSKYAMFLVHKCSNFIDAWGNYNADQIQALIDDLQKNKKENDRIDVVIAQLYAKKTGKSISDLLAILKEGRWLTAQEALDYGFVDELTEDEGESKQNLTSDLREKFNAFGIPFAGLEPEPEKENETRSILRQILDFVKSIAPGQKTDSEERPAVEDTTPPAAEEPAEETTEKTIENQNQTEMKTIACYAAIMAALSLKEMQAHDDDSVTLTKSDLEALEKRLNDLSADVAARDKTIGSLTTQVENLKKQPGDDTKDNLDDTEPKEMSAEDMYKLSNEFLA